MAADTLAEVTGIAKNYGDWILTFENVWGVAVTMHPLDPKTGKFTLVVMHVNKMKEKDQESIRKNISAPVIFKCEEPKTAMKYMKKV